MRANLPGSIFDGAEIISAYTRRQAIEDGVLVQLSGPGYVGDDWIPKMVDEAGILYPVAMTAEAFDRYVWPIDDPKRETWLKEQCQDIQGRLWDVLMMFKHGARHNGGNTILFKLYCVTKPGRLPTKPHLIRLKAVCGPDDDCSPCITIMLPEED
jgi:hypothetical protein